jgi:hypothetical protein
MIGQLAAALFAGLSSLWTPATGPIQQWDVVIGDLPPVQVRALTTAIDLWQKAIPEVHLDLVTSGRPYRAIYITGSTIASLTRIVQQDAAPGVTLPNILGLTWDSSDNHPYIRIRVAIDADPSEHVGIMAHELGHAMGLDHNANRNALMYQYQDGSKRGPTSLDVRAWYAIYRPDR